MSMLPKGKPWPTQLQEVFPDIQPEGKGSLCQAMKGLFQMPERGSQPTGLPFS